jgi:Zn-finger nucleic acid-binding protein
MNETHHNLTCPGCSTKPMATQRMVSKKNNRSIDIDHCRSCLGVWFDTGELIHYLGDSPFEYLTPLDKQVSSMRCPRCDLSLLDYEYPSPAIRFHACNLCAGLWASKDTLNELERIKNHVEKPTPFLDILYFVSSCF